MRIIIGGVEDIQELMPRDSAFFKEKFDIDFLTRHEVDSVNSASTTLIVRNFEDGAEFEDHFDKLILASGASPFVLKITGIDLSHVLFPRNVQTALAIKSFIDSNKPKTTVIAGTEFIGFDVFATLITYKANVDELFHLDLSYAPPFSTTKDPPVHDLG